MEKALHHLLPYNLQMYFTNKSNEYGIETKQQNMFCQYFVHTTKKQHCTSDAGLKLWNSININLENSYGVSKFNFVK